MDLTDSGVNFSQSSATMRQNVEFLRTYKKPKKRTVNNVFIVYIQAIMTNGILRFVQNHASDSSFQTR